jgi:hypothetical protein
MVAEDGSLEMNDQVVARCQEMELEELASFIGDSLEKIHNPDPGRGRPRTYEEFRIVWRLLRKKSDAMPHNPSAPRNPLEKAYAKRRRAENLLYGKSPDSARLNKKDMRQIKRTLDSLNLHIEASGEYDRPPRPAPQTTKQAAARIASEVFEAIERAFKHLTKGRRSLQWRPGRSGSLSIGNIRRYCEERRRSDPEFKYDMGRIEKAYELGPDDPPWEGPDGFDGYVIFTFPDSTKALMECPEIGHAAYVIHKDWASWSQMDKQELMAEAEKGGDVTRIPHQGENWPAKVRQALGLG